MHSKTSVMAAFASGVDIKTRAPRLQMEVTRTWLQQQACHMRKETVAYKNGLHTHASHASSIKPYMSMRLGGGRWYARKAEQRAVSGAPH